MKNLSRNVAITATALLLSSAAHAGFVEVTVDARSGPWNWTSGGLNSALAYGPAVQDFSAPTVIDLASIGSGPGNSLYILYKSGLTDAFGGPPSVDQAGYVGSPFKDDALGSSGDPFPSLHMPSNWGINQEFPAGTPVTDPENYGVFLQALVGALTDASGAVLDNPFPIGSVIPVDDGLGGYAQGFVIGISFGVSNANAVNLQLGFNDDTFFDNTGALQVCVASSQADMDACIAGTASTVPEIDAVTGTGALTLLAGALTLAGERRRRREA